VAIVDVLDDSRAFLSLDYPSSFALMRTVLEGEGGKIVETDDLNGFIRAKFRYGINLSGLIVTAQFRRAEDGKNEVVVRGRIGDAFDTAGGASKRAREVFRTLIAEAERAVPVASSAAGYAAPLVGDAAIAHRRKSKTTAALLALFLGILGAHRFYLGSWGLGVLYLLLLLAFPFGVLLALFDAVRFFAMGQHGFDRRYNFDRVGPFTF
jgi:TM2 domain-containing membrane protein YozV